MYVPASFMGLTFKLIDAVTRSIRGTKATNVFLSANAATLHNGAALMQQQKSQGPKFPNGDRHSGMGPANAVKDG
jgi:hypothetical protein